MRRNGEDDEGRVLKVAVNVHSPRCFYADYGVQTPNKHFQHVFDIGIPKYLFRREPGMQASSGGMSPPTGRRSPRRGELFTVWK